MILGRVLNAASDRVSEITSRKKKPEKIIRGVVVLVKKNVLDFKAIHTSIADSLRELVGKGVTLQLVSRDNADPGAYFIQLCFNFSLLSRFCLI